MVREGRKESPVIHLSIPEYMKYVLVPVVPKYNMMRKPWTFPASSRTNRKAYHHTAPQQGTSYRSRCFVRPIVNF